MLFVCTYNFVFCLSFIIYMYMCNFKRNAFKLIVLLLLVFCVKATLFLLYFVIFNLILCLDKKVLKFQTVSIKP